MSEAPAPLCVSVETAAEMLGIGRSLAYRMAKEGSLPTVKMGRRLLVPISKLEEMLAR